MFILSTFIMMIMSIFFFFFFMYSLMFKQVYLIEIMLNFNMEVVDGEIIVLFDWISCLFVSVVLLITGMVMMYSESYMSEDTGKNKFFFLILLFVISMIIMILSSNIMMILLGWDGLGLISYCLVIFYMNEASMSSGMMTIMTNRLGDSGVVMVIIFMINLGNFNFSSLNFENLFLMNLLCLMMILGALTKSAQLPFSAWLPAAMAAPTPVSALVHSSTLVTAGVYLIMRFNLYFNGGSMSEMLLLISILTMFMSGLGALYEMDLKKVIALSTLSQLGVMMMILSVGKLELAFFHLIIHALFKAMLFLCAGVFIHLLNGWQDIRMLGLSKNLSMNLTMIFLVGSLTLMGFPFLSGFYSSDLILEFIYLMNLSFFIIMIVFLSTLFTILYSFRLMYYLYFKVNMMVEVSFNEDKNLYNPVYMMGFTILFLGCFFNWFYFFEPNFIMLMKKIKLMNFFFIFIGGYFMINNFFIKDYMYNSKLKSFFNEMWFLKNLSSGFFFNFFILMKMESKQTELWLEELGGGGFKYMMESLMLKNVILNFNGLKMFLIMFFMLFFMMNL